MENRTYVIGRKGQIQLFDKTASAKHAELTVLNDTMYLSDLGSTNGTFIVIDGKRKPFTEGYIDMNQTLSFGNQVCTVRELIARAEVL